MNCPHCKSTNTRQCKQVTYLGYLKFRCRQCDRQFNERTGTIFNYFKYPTEVVILAVCYYYQLKTSLDDVVNLMMKRGFNLRHQTIWNWMQTVRIETALQFRENRIKEIYQGAYTIPIHIKIEGRWCYFYRAFDWQG